MRARAAALSGRACASTLQLSAADNGATSGTFSVSSGATLNIANNYTLLAASSGPVSIAPSLQKLPYAPLTDLSPVSVVAVNPFALVVNPNFPANNAKEFIAKLKAAPDKYTFASSGTGATAHLITAYFNSIADVQTRHIPYKGSVPALTDIMGGQVDYTFETVPSVVAHVKAGKLKTFGVSYTKRSAAMPDVPTIAEVTGLTNFNIGSWIGYMGPAGMPKEIADRLNETGSRAAPQDGTITLATRNDTVNRINSQALGRLPGRALTAKAEVSGDFGGRLGQGQRAGPILHELRK